MYIVLSHTLYPKVCLGKVLVHVALLVRGLMSARTQSGV